MSTTVRPELLDALKTDHLKADLKGRSIRGGVLTLTSQGARFILQMISTVVLARLLTPADFGLVAMVTAITGFVALFTDAGLSHATVQRQEITHDQVSTLFWINVALGVLLMFVTATLAPAVAWFYSEPRLTGITLAVAGMFILSGLTVQHDALLKRQMRYRPLAIRNIVASAAGVLVAIVMAWQGAGYWALLALPATMSLVQMLLSWCMVNWRPGLPRRSAEVRSMLIFGGNLMGSNAIAHISRNADNVLIGWFWGPGPLGLYSRAYSLLMLPLHQFNAPIAAVAMPAFSRIQDDPERYARYYLRTINMIMWMSAPLIGFLFVGAEPVIVLTLGDQWRDSAVVFQILAVSALTQPLYNSIGWLFVSRGRTDRLLKLGLFILAAVVCSFVIGLPFGIRGVALSYSLVLLAILPWTFQFTFRGTHLTLKRFGRALLCPVSLGLAAAFFAALAVHVIAPEGNLSRLLVIALGFAIVYSFSLLIPPVREEVLSLRNLLRELRPSRRTE